MKKYILLSIAFIALTNNSYAQDILLLKTDGKVVIGDTTLIGTPGEYNLYVQNGILTEKVKVALRDASQWSDSAFSKTPSLSEVENSIKTKSHLPAIPSAQSLVETGYELQDMDAKLLAQIEWLWQHTIKLNEENIKLRKEMEKIKIALKSISTKN